MKISEHLFGQYKGTSIYLYNLENSRGTNVTITNVGGIITSIKTADKDGAIGEISLGFDDPTYYLSDAYRNDLPYLGALVGRYANRIANGRFTIEGKQFELETNNSVNHLHGGVNSFDAKIWTPEVIEQAGKPALALSYLSPNLENGYPGNLQIRVIYSLSENNELGIKYEAHTDEATYLNLTNHCYFNLNKPGTKVYDHEVLMNAHSYTPKDESGIPLGTIELVENTPLDFTEYRKIGDRINAFADGYDHNYVIDGKAGELKLAAYLKEENSGRRVSFYTTEPGFQFYTGHYLSGNHGRDGASFSRSTGVCLEAQHYPNSPNVPSFPTTLLKPGQKYEQVTVYKFELIS